MPTPTLTLEEMERTTPPVNEVEAALRQMWGRIRPGKRTDRNVLRRLQRACIRVGSLEALKGLTHADLPAAVGGGPKVQRPLSAGLGRPSFPSLQASPQPYVRT